MRYKKYHKNIGSKKPAFSLELYRRSDVGEAKGFCHMLMRWDLQHSGLKCVETVLLKVLLFDSKIRPWQKLHQKNRKSALAFVLKLWRTRLPMRANNRY